jgi:hypothetical protein
MDTHHRTLVTRFLIPSCLFILIFRGPTESATAGQLTVQATVVGTDQAWNLTPGGLNTNSESNRIPRIQGTSEYFGSHGRGSESEVRALSDRLPEARGLASLSG